MSYKITTRVFQPDTSTFFQVIEKGIWNNANGGSWAGNGGLHILTMAGSGNSGTLRIASDDDNEIFLLALGFHNDKPWINIQPDLRPHQTDVFLHPEYYKAGTAEAAQREKQLTEYSVTTSKGRVISINCAGSGERIGCDVIIS